MPQLSINNSYQREAPLNSLVLGLWVQYPRLLARSRFSAWGSQLIPFLQPHFYHRSVAELEADLRGQKIFRASPNQAKVSNEQENLEKSLNLAIFAEIFPTFSIIFKQDKSHALVNIVREEIYNNEVKESNDK